MLVTKECPNCHKSDQFKVSDVGYARWRAGEYIQDALPELNPTQREQLMTGICAKCWHELFPPDPGQPAECWGCLTGHDVGVPSDAIAYTYPGCPAHDAYETDSLHS